MAIKGKIEARSENKAGYWAYKVNGDWYNTGSKDEPEFDKGDFVSFDYYKKDGKWLTIKGDVTAAKGGSSSSSSGSAGRSSGGANREGYWEAKAATDAAKEPRIAFQCAYERALELFKLAQAAGAYPSLEKVKPAEKLGAIRALVEAEANHIMQLAWNAKPPKADKPAEASGDDDGDSEGDDEGGKAAGWDE